MTTRSSHKGTRAQRHAIWFVVAILFVSIVFSCSTEDAKIRYGSNEGKYVNINNTQIYFEEYGAGTPLILISGGGLQRSIRDFENSIPDLSKKFRVIVPDTPGQGKSGPIDTISYQILTNYWSTFIDSLKVDSVYVMGWSDGGIASLLLANQRSDKVRKIIAVGANDGARGFALPEGLVFDSVKIPSVDNWAKFHEKDIAWYDSLTPKKDWRKMAQMLNTMWYEKEYFPVTIYDSITIPVMVVLGDRDDISLDHGLAMHRRIKNSQYCVLPGTSHDVFFEKPELINRIAVDFFVK